MRYLNSAKDMMSIYNACKSVVSSSAMFVNKPITISEWKKAYDELCSSAYNPLKVGAKMIAFIIVERIINA